MKLFNIDVDNLNIEEIGQWPWVLKGIVWLILMLFLFVLGYFLDIQYLWDTLEQCRSKRIEAQHEYLKSMHQAKNIVAYQLQAMELKTSIAKSQDQLPDACGEAELLETLSAEAAQCGLHFKAIKPLPEEKKESYSIYPFEMLLSGTFHQLGEFSDRIANLPRIVTLHDFSLQKEKNSNALDILLQARVYWTNAKDEQP